MRCAALARQLISIGAQVTFLCRAIDVGIARQLEQSGIAVSLLPAAEPVVSDGPYFHSRWLSATQDDDAAGTITFLQGRNVDWLIVDHYGIGAPWEVLVGQHVGRIAVIDDLADRPHACSILIDSNPLPQAGRRYLDLVPPGILCLEGPAYIMLRPEFAALSGQTRAVPDVAQKILVSFGGFDAQNFTMVALDALERLAEPVVADFIVGAGHPSLDGIQARVAAHSSWHVHTQTSEVAELMLAADLAIGAGGQMAYERACLGLPAIAICAAENQREQIEAAERAGFLLSFSQQGDLVTGLAQVVRQVMHDKEIRLRMHSAGQRIVDGRGVKRIVSCMLDQTKQVVRPARGTDMEMIRDWRNDDRARAVSGSTSVVDAATHQAWFTGKLENPDCVMLVAEIGGLPCGVVRFDTHNDVARVSIFLAPPFIGFGLGRNMMRTAEAHLRQVMPQVRSLQAVVAEGHLVSTKLFHASGYAKRAGLWEKVLDGEA